MAHRMLRFTELERDMPDKRDASDRRDDFREIYGDFTEAAAAAQASRCSQCGIPFCQQGCPLTNDIPDWLMLTAEGRLQEAYELAQSTNTLPEVCGRICPQDRLCEGICTIEQSGHGTVTIGSVERYLADKAFEEGWVAPIAPPKERGQSAGIIGCGPGGLAAAERLRRRGYQVTVYDRYDRGGGLMMYGIPGFKLEKRIVERRLKQYEDGGIVFRYNCEIGRDITLAELREQHDTVLIATGVYKARSLSMPGAAEGAIVPALDYLTASNRADLGDAPAPEAAALHAEGKDVVVIGGGDTAMDCVRTAIRQDAASVTCLYRRDRDNMPGSQREVANAEEEGVVFEWLASPDAMRADEGGLPVAVRGARMKLGAADASGRRAPERTEERFERPAALVIGALGFEPEDLPTLFDEPALTVNRWGAVRIDFKTMETSLPGVYAAGDIVRGASLVVWAIKDGRDAADAMHAAMKEAARNRRDAAVAA